MCRGYQKEGTRNCDFLVWKDNNGRYINRSVVVDLLENGVTRELDGFKSASGKSFKATLELENGNVVRKNTEAPVDDVTFEVDETPLGQCPIHEGACKVIETAHEFSCIEREEERAAGEKRPQGFYFPRLLCKRD